ncbi:hypothetical protein EJB05_15934, partial [Eragrostis curvula]
MATPPPFRPRLGGLVLSLLLVVLSLCAPAAGDPRTTVAGQTCAPGAAVSGSVLADNFVPSMDDLNSNVSAHGFGTSAVGTGGPNTVFGLGQCLRDLSPVDCKLCFAEVRSLLPKCYPRVGGRLYLDGCFGRYANYSFFGEAVDAAADAVSCGGAGNETSAAAPRAFVAAVRAALANVTGAAAARGSDGFAVAEAAAGGATAFALAQCWETLNATACAQCLRAASDAVARCAPAAAEGRALFAGCYVRYSTSRFWNVNATAADGSSGSNDIVWILLGSIFGALAIVFIIGFLAWKKRILRSQKGCSSFIDTYGDGLSVRIAQSSLNFKYEELRKATNYFDPACKLGQGSYGAVYKAILLDGKEVAVKRLFLNTRQWADQFFNEVDLISQVRHKNLVKLLGCSVNGPESLLVYEYYYNKSLDIFLFDASRRGKLNWDLRVDIIQGIAEGLSYLHEESETRIIHRDIKASNILLDDKFKPKITDFGLARAFGEDITHLTTGIAGTLGYMAPEYVVHGHLTKKADVFSYGVLVLEIVTGKRCSSSNGSHGGQVWKHYKDNTVEMIVDRDIYDDTIRDEVMHLLQIGLLCTQANPDDRPTMGKVVELLRNRRHDLKIILSDPPFLTVEAAEDIKEGEHSRLLSTNSAPSLSGSSRSYLSLIPSMRSQSFEFLIFPLGLSMLLFFLLLHFAMKFDEQQSGRFTGCIMRHHCSFLVAPIIIACLSSWLTTTTQADPRATLVCEFCNKTIAAGPGAVWANNFVVAFDNLHSDLEQQGYGITSVGQDPITYYGLVQCLEDLSKVDCTLCYSEIRSLLPKCYPEIGGRIYLDGCFMRYANYSFFDEFTDSLDTSVCSFRNLSSDQRGFISAVNTVLSNVTSLAIKSNKGFAVTSVSRSPKLAAYALAQCWQNLNTSSCAACLSSAAASVAKCAPAEEGRALFAGCFIRYSTTPFWNSRDSTASFSSRKHIVLWTILSSSIGIVLLLLVSVSIWKNKKARKARERSLRGLYGSELPIRISQSCLNFSYKDLKKGTGGFSLDNKLGQGSNGTVYKAVLAGGDEVAAKRLFLNTKQCIDQFFNEVDVISQMRHKNLVKLLGCSVDGPESFLIYEYHFNRSLDLFLFAEDQNMLLDWLQRFDVILGIAEGLCYLHEESETRIIHQDIKASNVLLDHKLKPKITDFGLARVLCGDRTHLTTGIAGTVGYMAPEYVVHGHLTEKADVYSFGVLVIEIVTGRRCCGSTGSHSGHSLLAEVCHNYKANTTEKVIDAILQREQGALEEVTRVVEVGLLCAQADPDERPPMSRVVELLRDREGTRGDVELVLGDPPFFDVEADAVGVGGGGETPTLTLLPRNSTSEISVSYSEFSGR